jgi:hypothetical protein
MSLIPDEDSGLMPPKQGRPLGQPFFDSASNRKRLKQRVDERGDGRAGTGKRQKRDQH